ncbi:MAG: DUF1080 domain-containing protein [Planctomycetaceae bacterium]
MPLPRPPRRRDRRPTRVPILPLVLLALAPLAAAPAQPPAAAPDPALAAAERVARILAAVPAEPIFNGRDLAGWTGDTAGYAVEDGILVCRKGGKTLETIAAYGDFALTFEFRLESSGNNGIGIRVPRGGYPSRDGVEIQILDHDGPLYGQEAEVPGAGRQRLTWLKPWQYHGSVYGITPARTGQLKPVGQWNRETIVAVDDHVIVILNGAVIVDTFLDDAPVLDGAPHPGKDSRRGHIVLAGHDDRVEFRDLTVADLSPTPPTARAPADNVPPPGFTALFDGRSLAGWKGLAHADATARRALAGADLEAAQARADATMREHWRVADGVLAYDGKGDSLCTAGDYGDFELLVDWKIPPGADSGIYLRGTPQIQIWDPWDPRVGPGKPDPATAAEWVAQYANGRNLGSGGLWNNRQWRSVPLALADRKPGEWNTFLVRMVGERVSVWLNDTLVVDRVKLEDYWSKGARPVARADQIELQHHGSELFFRNLFIRELPW